jgi:hypothetical protein
LRALTRACPLERDHEVSASSRERSLWSVNVARRRGGTASVTPDGVAAVEADAERQVVRQAAVDRDGRRAVVAPTK